MRFRELLNRAKTMDDTAMVQILELYNPLLYKYANVNSRFDQDLYEEFDYMCCEVPILINIIMQYIVLYG